MYDLIGRDCLVDDKHIFRCIGVNSFAMRPVFELYPSGPKFLLPDYIDFRPVLDDPMSGHRPIIIYEDALDSIEAMHKALPSYITSL